jgi:6-phosphogluconolactonase
MISSSHGKPAVAFTAGRPNILGCPGDGRCLSTFQTITTLPAGYTETNTCSQIHLALSEKFLYAPNQGHNSIAGFSVNIFSGGLPASGHVSTAAVPSVRKLDPEGRFLFSAGEQSGRLASNRINGDSGELTPLETSTVGQRPLSVLVTCLGG